MSEFKKYEPAFFNGGARSYAAEGWCSFCKRKRATWMRTWKNQRGPTGKTYCNECKARLEKRVKKPACHPGTPPANV